MGNLFLKQDIFPVIGYTFSLLRRINSELKLSEDLPVLKDISLVGVKVDFLDGSVMEAIIKTLRNSDALFLYEDFAIFLLFGTDKEGAIHLMGQLKDFFGESMEYTVATSPEDGKDELELIKSFRTIIKLKFGLDIYSL